MAGGRETPCRPKESPMQQLYGFTRTICACETCTDSCRHLSGMVLPADLALWSLDHPDDFHGWCLTHLAASPGALVLRAGQAERIRTIVPARLPGGACHWLTADERCAIHDSAPFGCAYFDCSQRGDEGAWRSQVGLALIAQDWHRQGAYSQLWHTLWDA